MSFPWSAVVGQDALKHALLLCAIDPAIGGVLVSGPRGVAKTTLARGLAELVPGAFVELPLGATEERVTGSLNLERVLADGRVEFAPGLLARAHDGVLYVDEVNLLPDAIVDLLLDAAASGKNVVERDGVSHAHAARFVLVGSMNPDEGELRPQLIDRFGLAASAEGQVAPADRAQIVLRRLAFDRDPEVFRAQYTAQQTALVERCRSARERAQAIALDGPALAYVTERCAAAGVEGVRADLAMLRAARANAAWHGRSEITIEDVDAVAELALAHRRPRAGDAGPGGPGQSGGPRRESGARGQEAAGGSRREGGAAHGGGRQAGRSSGAGREPSAGASPRQSPEGVVSGAVPAQPVRAVAAPELPRWLREPRGSMPGHARRGRAQRSALAGERRQGRASDVALAGMSARGVASRGSIAWFTTLRAGKPLRRDQLRYRMRRRPSAQLWIVAVDCSASMLNSGGLALAKGVANALEAGAKRVGARLALISFRGAGATLEVDSSPGRAALPRAIASLGGGGGTPLRDALRLAQSLCRQSRWRAPGVFKRLIVLTDGRVREAASLPALPSDLERIVIDCERGRVRLGRSVQLSAALHGVCVPLA